MISKQKILLVSLAGLVAICIFINLSRLVPESKNQAIYASALTDYNNNNYSDAYYAFGKVTRFSKLKPAAIYRQALCADRLGDIKTKIKKYKEVIRNYPNTRIALITKYYKAQQYYKIGNYRSAENEFLDIIAKFPQTDYATAAQYYLGSIASESASKISNINKKVKVQNKAIEHYKLYLTEAPTGRFAKNCIQKWLLLNRKLNNADNLLIADVYQQNDDFKDAEKYLGYTTLNVSWPYLVRNAYKLHDVTKVKYYTELGLKSTFTDDTLLNEKAGNNPYRKNVYKAIDYYLDISGSPKADISYLLSISRNSSGYDYLLYKNCNNLSVGSQAACFSNLYSKFPEGQFAAEALSNVFYSKIKAQQYYEAKKLGRLHLIKYPHSNSTPKVMFWLGKIDERTKNYDEAKSYYKAVIKNFPDDYYAYHAYLNLNRYRRIRINELSQKRVEFPYKNSSSDIVSSLTAVKDYGLINELYKDDDFIQSWLAYSSGDYSKSSRIARDAMENLSQKPGKEDPRWLLVYPIHYYDNIVKYARYRDNDPILILSIIREESYFNPAAQSPVGALGLMQLMPSTAREAANAGGVALSDMHLLFNPDINIELGNVYYSRLKKGLLGKDVLAVLAYNGGLGSVSNWTQNLNYIDVDDFVEQIPYQETQNYLKKVYRSYWNYLRIYSR